MRSTEAILASDCPFRESDRQYFGENRHPDSGNRLFQPLIDSLAPSACLEMTTFSNDTSADNRKERAGVPGVAGQVPGMDNQNDPRMGRIRPAGEKIQTTPPEPVSPDAKRYNLRRCMHYERI